MSQQADPEEGNACLKAAGGETRKERAKRRCYKGVSFIKLCCLANVGLLTALIYLITETKAGVQLADKLLQGAADFAFGHNQNESGEKRDDSLGLLAQLLYNFSLARNDDQQI